MVAVSFRTFLVLTTMLGALLRPSCLWAQVRVSPDGDGFTTGSNTSGNTAWFSLTGLVNGQTYSLEWYCSGQVISCTSPDGSSLVASAYGNSWRITFNTGASGTGTVKLKAFGPGGSDSGWFNVTVDGTGPDIRLLAPTGDVAVEFPTIQIAWCDNTSLSSSTRWIKVNGVLKTSNFDYVANSGPSDCTIKATSTSTTVSLVGGSNQVEARICDNFNNCTIRYFTITRISPPIVTPKGDKRLVSPTTTNGASLPFTI